MLLSCLKCQNESSFALGILCFTNETTYDLTHVLLGGCQNSKIWTAVSQSQSQRLSLCHNDIRTDFARCFQNAQGNRVHAHDQLCAGTVNDFCDCIAVFDDSVEVRILHQEASGFIVCLQRFLQCYQIGRAGCCRNWFYHGILTECVGLDYAEDSLVHGIGYIDCGMLPILCHCACFCRCGSAVVHGCVGNVHVGQLAHHGLIFKDGLQDTLADFRLIRGIRGNKFFLGYHLLHNRRYVVIISARSPENMSENTVFFRIVPHFPDRLHFRHAFRYLQLSLQPYLRRDPGK